MTPKQKRFVEEYALDHNAAAAARRAGASERSARTLGSRWLAKVDVLRSIQSLENAAAVKLSLTREDALQGLLAAKDEAVEQKNCMGQISAWREIGKMCGFYRPETLHKVEITEQGRALLKHYETLSEAELIAIISADATTETV